MHDQGVAIMATRFRKLLAGIGEIIEVTEIGLAFQDGRLTAAEASEAISRVGRSGQEPRNADELVDA